MPDGTAAGQYILHYGGYRDCIDVDLLPAALGLPDTSDAKYGYEVLDPEQISWSRTDHCQYEEHEPYVGSRTDCFPNSGGTCFVIPPPGETNAHGETAAEALAACQARCNRNKNRCKAVVVVPVAKLRRSPSRTARRARRGGSATASTRASRASMRARRCATGCAAPRPRMWRRRTVVDRDPEDEIFYSTCYRRNPVRAFAGPACGEECYGAGAAAPPPPWRFEERCVSCDDAAANALPSAVPHWSLATDCEVCHRDDVGAAQPEPPPPPAAVTPEPPAAAAAPAPPPSPPPPAAFGLSGCSDGSWCCVAIFKGARARRARRCRSGTLGMGRIRAARSCRRRPVRQRASRLACKRLAWRDARRGDRPGGARARDVAGRRCQSG